MNDRALQLLRELWRHHAAGDLLFTVCGNGNEIRQLLQDLMEHLAKTAPTKSTKEQHHG